MISGLTNLPREIKRLIALVIDVCSLLFAFVLSYSLYSESLFIPSEKNVFYAIALTTPISLALFAKLGLYRAVVRYIAMSALIIITLGVLGSALVLEIANWLFDAGIPLSVVINFGFMALVFVGGLRLLMRALYEQRASRKKSAVIVYGAGSAGRQLAQSLTNGAEYNPVCFIDDDETLHGSSIMGMRVRNPNRILEWINRYQASHVLLAIPSATRSRRKEILEQLEPLKVSVQTIPGMSDMVSGNMRIDELQDVRIEDLLGRDPVEPSRELMDLNIRDKVVLVTGSGGSIGSELCRQIIRYQPKTLVLFESSEYNLYAIERELKQIGQAEGLTTSIKSILGSVTNQEQLHKVMTAFKVNTVYHAAAYKHVPLVEYNIAEGIRNNILGTLSTAEAAIASNVENFVLISTDKAVRPTNVMGATKRFAELVLQGLAKRQAQLKSTRTMHISMVRFGNVLGSSGSVVPLFRRQIEAGGPVTVTDPEITRYFMTIPEAAQLVIQAGAMGSIVNDTDSTNEAQVYVLDMGEPVKIVDLARKLIRLMGLEIKCQENPHGDIEIQYSGLRPGEKLYEELLIGDEVSSTSHERIMSANELSLNWDDIEELLSKLEVNIKINNIQLLHQTLVDAPLLFSPVSGISDLVWDATHSSSKTTDNQNNVDTMEKSTREI